MQTLTPQVTGTAAATASPRPPPHVPALDGLRGVAVLLVFFYHYGGGAQSANPILRAVGILNKAGWAGVTLFFVLSGFLITGILWDSIGQPHWARNFYMRRVLRIFPLYYAVVLVVLLAGAWQHSLGPSSRIAITLATFTQNFPYFQTHGRVPAPIFHLWSIAVEEQFYLLWPFLLVLVRRWKHAIVLPLGLFTAMFLYRLILWRISAAPELYEQTLLVRGGELAAGAALALAMRAPYWSRMLRLSPWAFALSAAAFLLACYRAHSFQLLAPVQWVWGLPAITLCCAALLTLVLRAGIAQRVFALAPLRYIGRISYGIYIFHFLLLHNVNQAAAALSHAKQGTAYELSRLVIASIATLTAAILSYHLLERPFLRLKRFYPSSSPVPNMESHPLVARPTGSGLLD